MGIHARTQNFISSSLHLNKYIQFYKSSIGSTSLFSKIIQSRTNEQNHVFRLCRPFHTSREPRASFAKLSPQELIQFAHADFLNNKCNSTGWSCLDCYTRKLCLGTTLWGESTCMHELTQNQQAYCDPKTDKCVNSEPDGCKSISKFQCIRNDIFPDIQNCSRYFICNIDEVETNTCNSTYYYKPTWNKCVFKVSDSDCNTVTCSFLNTISLHNDDPSLYYECKNSIPTLKGCPASTEYYDVNTKTCNSICNESNLGAMPNTRDCTKYYDCKKEDNNYVLKNMNCNSTMGFNSITKQCEKKYNVLCNELKILESDVDLILSKIPFVKQAFDIIKSIFRLFKFNPFTILLSFGIRDDNISAGIMIFNYVIVNKRIPPAIIKNLLNKILSFLPLEIRTIIEKVITFIPSFKKSVVKRNVQESTSDIEHFLEYLLTNINFDLDKISYSLNNKLFLEIINDAGNYLASILKIPDEKKNKVLNLMQNNLIFIISYINKLVGENILILNENTIQVDFIKLIIHFQEYSNVILHELQKYDYRLAEILKMLIDKYENDANNYIKLYFYKFLKTSV